MSRCVPQVHHQSCAHPDRRKTAIWKTPFDRPDGALPLPDHDHKHCRVEAKNPVRAGRYRRFPGRDRALPDHRFAIAGGGRGMVSRVRAGMM